MNRYTLSDPKVAAAPFRVGDRVKPNNRKLERGSNKRGEVIEFGSHYASQSWVQWDDTHSIVLWDNDLLIHE
jgi:hypothetical protein